MKKIVLGLVLGFFLSNNCFALTEAEVKKYFKNRKIEPIEGIWRFDHGTTAAIYKSENKYFIKIIYSKKTASGKDYFEVDSGSKKGLSGYASCTYSRDYVSWGSKISEANYSTCSYSTSLINNDKIKLTETFPIDKNFQQEVTQAFTLSRIWPDNFQAYNANFKSKNDIAEDEKNLAIMVRDAKKTCRVLGFKDNEPKFNDCTLKIYTQKNDDLIQQRKAQSQNQSRKAQSQNQSTSQPGTNTNTIIMQGSGGSDNSQEMMDRGLDMLSGRRGVDGSIRSAPSAPIINRQVCTSIVISRNPYMTREVCR